MVSHDAAYLEIAESALGLIQDPSVAARWEEPSALPKMSVGALASHLAGQVFSTREIVAAGQPEDDPIPLLEHYHRAAWVEADLDDEANVSIRDGAASSAEPGHAALVDRLAEALSDVRALLGSDPPAVVRIPWQGWSLTLEDFFVTRMMELTVHSDDLAASVGVEPPTLPDEALAPVLRLLTSLAVRRHGQSAVVTALARAERAPSSIAAF